MLKIEVNVFEKIWFCQSGRQDNKSHMYELPCIEARVYYQ